MEVHNIRELICKEQTERDKDVDEYLLLALRADKQQRVRLKAHFKKKNTRSTQEIHMLQQKLVKFQNVLRELEARGAAQVCHQSQEPKMEVLRRVGVGLKCVNILTLHILMTCFGVIKRRCDQY